MMGMIDVVYAVGPYSKYGDAELRYSLRSLEMHGRGLRDLWIIGHCPEWICPDHHLRIPDFSGNPHACTALKVLVACAQPELTEQFVFMSDDFFIGKDVDLIELPHYYLGTLSRVAVHHGGAYQQALRNTAAALSGLAMGLLPHFLLCQQQRRPQGKEKPRRAGRPGENSLVTPTSQQLTFHLRGICTHPKVRDLRSSAGQL